MPVDLPAEIFSYILQLRTQLMRKLRTRLAYLRRRALPRLLNFNTDLRTNQEEEAWGWNMTPPFYGPGF